MNAKIKVLQIAKHNIESKLEGTEKQYKMARFNYHKSVENKSASNIKAGLLVNYEKSAEAFERLKEMIAAASEMLEEEKGKLND